MAIVLEQARGAVIYALLSADFVRLYPVNPQSLASYRKAYAPSGAKSDPADAVLLMEMVRNSPERFRVWRPDDADTRSLQLLTENRRQLVNQKTALASRLDQPAEDLLSAGAGAGRSARQPAGVRLLDAVAHAGGAAASTTRPDSPTLPGAWASQSRTT